MPGSTNFLQWNPGGANQETDTQWAADALRTGGAPANAIFPSPTANKAFFQWSTMVAALAKMLSNKGFAVSDANFNNLVAVLNNLITVGDLAPYALKAGPVFTGDPQAPTPLVFDNDNSLATTKFVKDVLGAVGGFVFSPGLDGYIKFPTALGSFIVQWSQANADVSSGEVSATKNFPIVFPNACLNVQVSMQQSSGAAADCWYQIVSFNASSVTIFKQGTGAGLPVTTPYILAIGW